MMNLDASPSDSIKIMAHIDPATSSNTYMRLKSTSAYIRANLEGFKTQQRSKN